MSDFHAVLELIGEDMTLKLVEAYGGTRCAVPKALPEKHELRDLLGDTAFEELHRFFGGYELKLPLAKRWRLDVYRKQGFRTRDLARKTGYTERAVSRIINNEAAASWQYKLEI
jgi:hypothetical protein